jgi:hypothetical protein
MSVISHTRAVFPLNWALVRFPAQPDCLLITSHSQPITQRQSPTHHTKLNPSMCLDYFCEGRDVTCHTHSVYEGCVKGVRGMCEE